MLKATAGTMLPTTITGSLPRPSWYTENLGIKSFLDAMVISRFREQYVDALSVYLREQEVAGLDIVTDGDCRFDQDVGGQSWTSYPPHHMDGFETTHPKLAAVGAGGIAPPPALIGNLDQPLPTVGRRPLHQRNLGHLQLRMFIIGSKPQHLPVAGSCPREEA
mgnify:CR=1 FL=1